MQVTSTHRNSDLSEKPVTLHWATFGRTGPSGVEVYPALVLRLMLVLFPSECGAGTTGRWGV